MSRVKADFAEERGRARDNAQGRSQDGHQIVLGVFVDRSSEAGSLATGVAAVGAIDGEIVTSLLGSQAAYDAACAAFGAKRVHVPRLLRVQTASSVVESTEMAS